MTSARPASQASDEAGERGRWLGVGTRPVRNLDNTGSGYCDVVRALLMVQSQPSPTLIAPARHSRHILAQTSSQTISHRDLSLGSSSSLVYLAAIAWSRARRPCATPNMTVSSPRSSLDRSSFGIVTFTASRTLDVRFECLDVPMVCISNLGNTGSGYCNVVLALQRRSRHVQGKVLALWTSALYCNPKP